MSPILRKSNSCVGKNNQILSISSSKSNFNAKMEEAKVTCMTLLFFIKLIFYFNLLWILYPSIYKSEGNANVTSIVEIKQLGW
jgi:hypothetical protein